MTYEMTPEWLMASLAGSQAKILEATSEQDALRYVENESQRTGHSFTLYRLAATVRPGERMPATTTLHRE